MSELRVIIAGAGGRMGRTLIGAVLEAEGLALAGALERSGSPLVGSDAGTLAGTSPVGIAVADAETADLDGDVVIDFTAPASSVALARRAAGASLAHVIGTTGFSAEDEAAIAEAAMRIAIVKSGNMSLGVNLLAALTRRVAATLDESFDIEIVEMHHNRKVDAPSGTALMLGEAAAKGRAIELAAMSERGRDGHTGARRPGAIGFASLRGGTVVGEHDVIFAGPHERLVLRHLAEDRGIFARGALAAARWAPGRAPGLYAMADVLGLADF